MTPPTVPTARTRQEEHSDITAGAATTSQARAETGRLEKHLGSGLGCLYQRQEYLQAIRLSARREQLHSVAITSCRRRRAEANPAPSMQHLT